LRLEHFAVDDMLHQLPHGDVAVGFAMGSESSELLSSPLFDTERYRLLDVPPMILTKLSGQALKAHRLADPDRTPAVVARDGDGPSSLPPGPRERSGARTLKSRAVLVANEQVDASRLAYGVTKAIFEGVGLLENLDIDTLKKDIPSIPLNDQAKAYYQQRGFLATDDGWPWDKIIPILVGLATLGLSTFAAIVALRDRRAANEATVRTLAVDLGAQNTRAARELAQIRDDLRSSRARSQRPFRRADLNLWRIVNELIEKSLQIAFRAKAVALTRRVQAIHADRAADPAAVAERCAALRAEIDGLMADGEIERADYEFLLGLLNCDAPAEKGDDPEPLPARPEAAGCAGAAQPRRRDGQEAVEPLAVLAANPTADPAARLAAARALVKLGGRPHGLDLGPAALHLASIAWQAGPSRVLTEIVKALKMIPSPPRAVTDALAAARASRYQTVRAEAGRPPSPFANGRPLAAG
jgi:hypothetical protein